MSDERTSRKFSNEFKLMVVKRNLEDGESMASLCREYNLYDTVIRKWRKKYLSEGTFEKKASKDFTKTQFPSSKKFNSEIEKLRYENAKLKLENLYLKKLQVHARRDVKLDKN